MKMMEISPSGFAEGRVRMADDVLANFSLDHINR